MRAEKTNIILIGGGGHCKSCIEVIEATNLYNIVGILDLPSEKGKDVLGYEIIGNDDDYQKFKDLDYSFIITTGQIKSSKIRKRIFEALQDIQAKIETVIAPTATISKHAKIGIGSVVFHNCFINADANIGENCIINTAAIIEHDVIVGRHTHISTNSVINGNSKVGDNSFIGSNSCVSSGIIIGDEIVIGAGSTIVKNLLEAGTYVGSPTKIL